MIVFREKKIYNWSLVLRLLGKRQPWWLILWRKQNLPSKMAIFYFYLCSHLMWTPMTDIKYPSTKPLFGFCNQESRTQFLLVPSFWTLVCGFGEQVRQKTENPKRIALVFLFLFAHQTHDSSVHLGSPWTSYQLLPNTVAFRDEERVFAVGVSELGTACPTSSGPLDKLPAKEREDK